MCGGSRIVYPSRLPTLLHFSEELRKQIPPHHDDDYQDDDDDEPCFPQAFSDEIATRPSLLSRPGFFFTTPMDETVSSPEFLQSCFRCKRSLEPGMDIYMYRGDEAFCTPECRYLQMDADDRKEKAASSSSPSSSSGYPISCKTENEATEKKNNAVLDAVFTVEITS